MEKSLEKMIEDIKITKTVSKPNDIKITSEHEVCILEGRENLC